MTKLSFSRKDVFTIVTADDARDYIGTTGYFGNTLLDLQDAIDRRFTQTLANIDSELSEPFITEYGDTGEVLEENSSLFLPADKIKQKETKR